MEKLTSLRECEHCYESYIPTSSTSNHQDLFCSLECENYERALLEHCAREADAEDAAKFVETTLVEESINSAVKSIFSKQE